MNTVYFKNFEIIIINVGWKCSLNVLKYNAALFLRIGLHNRKYYQHSFTILYMIGFLDTKIKCLEWAFLNQIIYYLVTPAIIYYKAFHKHVLFWQIVTIETISSICYTLCLTFWTKFKSISFFIYPFYLSIYYLFSPFSFFDYRKTIWWFYFRVRF